MIKTCHVHIFFLSSTGPTAEQFSSAGCAQTTALVANNASEYSSKVQHCNLAI